MKNTAACISWLPNWQYRFFYWKSVVASKRLNQKIIAAFAFVIRRKTVRNTTRGHFVAGFSMDDDYQRVFLDQSLHRGLVSTCIPWSVFVACRTINGYSLICLCSVQNYQRVFPDLPLCRAELSTGIPWSAIVSCRTINGYSLFFFCSDAKFKRVFPVFFSQWGKI